LAAVWILNSEHISREVSRRLDGSAAAGRDVRGIFATARCLAPVPGGVENLMRKSIVLALVVMLFPVSAAQAQTPSFTSKGNFTAGSTPVALAAGDFNGDGKTDLAVANNDSDDVSVLFGNGDGTFLDSGAAFPLGDQGIAPADVAVGDFNNDGKLDIITANEIGGDNGSTVTVLLGSGGTTFALPISSATGTSPEAVVVGDFDGDGKLDAATADNFDDTVTILHGAGDGTFTIGQVVELEPGASPVGLAAADLDKDGKIDLVVTNSSGGGALATGSITVLKGVGDGTFVAQPEITGPPATPGPTPTSTSFNFDVPVAIAVGDLNGDGKPDLVVVNEDGDSVSILLGNGDLTFRAPSPASLSVGSLPESVVIADFNLDGKMDIATSASLDDKLVVLIGNGDGTFLPAQTFDVDSGPFGILTRDFNGDGKADLASANMDADDVTVLVNTSAVCTGDCDGLGTVTVNEIITMVNIALGSASVDSCKAGDADHSGTITVNEIIAAVNNALSGCTR
jgi:hypothetical protein